MKNMSEKCVKTPLYHENEAVFHSFLTETHTTKALLYILQKTSHIFEKNTNERTHDFPLSLQCRKTRRICLSLKYKSMKLLFLI